MWEKPRSYIAKELRVSDGTLVSRCKRLNIKIPSHGYWSKKIKNKSNVYKQRQTNKKTIE